jgi:hypothetical protein
VKTVLSVIGETDAATPRTASARRITMGSRSIFLMALAISTCPRRRRQSLSGVAGTIASGGVQAAASSEGPTLNVTITPTFDSLTPRMYGLSAYLDNSDRQLSAGDAVASAGTSHAAVTGGQLTKTTTILDTLSQ